MTQTNPTDASPLLHAILNLSKFHREHEKFYASAPREQAVHLQRHARTLQALADTCSVTAPSTANPLSPYEGAEDLNSPAALQLDGALFMEGEGRPAEITHLIRDVRTAAPGSTRDRGVAGHRHARLVGPGHHADRDRRPRRHARRAARVTSLVSTADDDTPA